MNEDCATMSNLLVEHSVNRTYATLIPIVAEASFLWERFDLAKFLVNLEQCHEPMIERRLNRWCEVVGQGDWNTLWKRLQWEGLDPDRVRPRLGAVQLATNQPLPEWAETLGQIINIAAMFDPESEFLLPIELESPIPFEDVLLSAIKVARQKLLAQLRVYQLSFDTFPLSVLSKTAYCSLERSLLQKLQNICSKTLYYEFSQFRPFGRNLLNKLGLVTYNSNQNVYYKKFVNYLLQDGLFNFFQKYPVLGRLMATAVDFWVETSAEFIQRLNEDREIIEQTYGSKIVNDAQNAAQKSMSIGKVSDIKISLSDSHNRGRISLILIFESGLKLVYKPKDLKLDVTFNQLLEWCNRYRQILDFKVIQILNRDGYGWVEYVEHQPCADETAIERFYQRAGMLLCLVYALRGADCHYENLIASGEHLVLIDIETLLHHDANLMEQSPAFQEQETTAMQQFWNSVLRTGLLPYWHFSADKCIAYDTSGLGSTEPQPASAFPCWQSSNTDSMSLRYETVTLPSQKNVPFLGNVTLSSNEYHGQIIDGFERMYRFLIKHKEVLLSSESPLLALQHQDVRFIFRSTRVCSTILQKAWEPDYLKHGVDYSIELDSLSQAFLVTQDKPDAWPILRAELQAMEQLDIPFFTASTTSDALTLSGTQIIPRYFKQSSYRQVLNQLQAMDETDLAQQVEMIQGAFCAKVARISPQDSQEGIAESLPLLSPEQLIQKARVIATELETKALQDPDGSLNWIGLGYVAEADRFQLQVLNDSLYDGRCGIALFFAALYQVSHEPRFCNLALRVLQPLRRRMRAFDATSQQHVACLTGLGGAVGIGSLIYTLVKVGQFLSDRTLWADAQILVDWIVAELITTDKRLNISSGSAGEILSLLSLYEATGEVTVLGKAVACGQHLLNNRITDEGFAKVRNCFEEMPLSRFFYGALGIAYALLRLYCATQERDYLQAALESIEYERSVLSKSNVKGFDVQASDFWIDRYHGSIGVGLGCLGISKMLDDPAIEHEIEIALQSAQNCRLQTIDHLYCGNLGRAEMLLVGSQRYLRPEWYESALQTATYVVAKAERTGAYQLFSNVPNSVFNPGFFQGMAGIGYQLLRLACDNLPSVLLWE